MYYKYSDAVVKLKEETVSAREQLLVAINRYAEVSLKVRNSQPRGFARGPDIIRFPWAEVQPELTFFPLLEKRLQEAKINFTRALDVGHLYGTLCGLRPRIDDLPQEILLRIFQFVRINEQCKLHLLGEHGTRGYPRYPDYLAQVCAYWRDITHATPSWWCHIDLAPHRKHHDLLIARAKDHANRAGQLPLEIHITDTDGSMGYNEGSLRQFFASNASRVKSLQVSHRFWHINGLEKIIFEELLRGSSETFTKFIVHSTSLPYAAFIEPTTEDNYDYEGLVTVDLSHEQIERSFQHLRVIHASELFPHWDSKAYHGLVDLRLASHCKEEITQLSESQLVAILTASPGLRVLHFALQLTNDDQNDTSGPRAVVLKDLEVLGVSSYADGDGDNLSQVASVLRLIAPGSKPLRLTLQTGTYSDASLLDTIKQFMLRSHISGFCAKKGSPPPYELLECAPHLTDLVFDRCSYDFTSNRHPVDPNRSSASESTIHLDSFHICLSDIYLDDLRLIVEHYSAQSVVVSNCRVYDKASAPGEVSSSKLVDLFSHSPHPPRFLTCEGLPPDPAEHWNELD